MALSSVLLSHDALPTRKPSVVCIPVLVFFVSEDDSASLLPTVEDHPA